MDSLQTDEYLTISKPAEGLFKAKGSKFMAYAYPVFNKTDIKKALETVQIIHPKARHHCYAWKLGLDENNYRANDDGEPSGSAGRPIYGQIRSKSLTNVIVIVVRYFGGTLLGVPGLIEAYKKSTFEALDSVEIVKKQIKAFFEIKFTYPQMNAVMTAVKKGNFKVINKSFTETCKLVVEMRQNVVADFEVVFTKIEGVKIEPHI